MDNEEINMPAPSFDDTLRPNTLDHFIGQHDLKKALRIFIDAARQRNEPLSHTLFYGPPGLGKTTLATIIAREMGVNHKVTSGPAMERTGDLAAILSNLEEGDVLFIDEIHRLNRSIEEILYPALEDFALDLILGKGPTAKTLRIDLPKFTLVGATTRIGSISAPMRDRFGFVSQLEFYTDKDLERIVKRSARILGVQIADSGAEMIAKRSRRTPRIANRLLQRVRDYAQVSSRPIIDEMTSREALDMLGVDDLGLDSTDRKILELIATKFEGGPVGIKTLAAAVQEESVTLEEVIEPFLLQLGFIDRSPQGRKITHRGLAHLDMAPKELVSR